MDVAHLDTTHREIVCTSSGYHMLTRRKVELSLAGGVLSLAENGRSRAISREHCQPISWIGKHKLRPLVPLAGLVLDGEGGSWVVSTQDMTIELGDAHEHESPHPHVFVSGDDLAAMAAACGISVARKPAPPMKVMAVPPMKWVIAAVVIVAVGNLLFVMAMKNRPHEPQDCSRQRQPVKELYPRLSCAEARAELDRVARGEAQPRSIVLRPTRLTIDAKDVVGPAKLGCDGLEFAVMNANQANPDAPIVYDAGPHSVLSAVLPDGTLDRPVYVICGNIVGSEKRGELPP